MRRDSRFKLVDELRRSPISVSTAATLKLVQILPGGKWQKVISHLQSQTYVTFLKLPTSLLNIASFKLTCPVLSVKSLLTFSTFKTTAGHGTQTPAFWDIVLCLLYPVLFPIWLCWEGKLHRCNVIMPQTIGLHRNRLCTVYLIQLPVILLCFLWWERTSHPDIMFMLADFLPGGGGVILFGFACMSS